MINKITKIQPVALSSAEIATRLAKVNASSVTQWTILNNELSTQLKFNNFESTWAFLQQVAMRSHYYGHHPTITTTYTNVKINLSTHDVSGISDIDFKFAARINKYAAMYTEATK